MRVFRTGLITAFAFALATIGSAIMSDPSDAQSAKPVTTPSGLQIIDTKVGTGATPRKNQTVVVHYTGWLYVNGAKGKKFELFGGSQRAVAVSRRRGPGDRGLG